MSFFITNNRYCSDNKKDCHLNFAELGLKKLISTHYDREEATYKMEYTGGDDNDIEAGVKFHVIMTV